MTEPLVSVKMLTYNHAPYISQAIEGILQQKTNFPFELVIGEDCSFDGTRAIVFEFQKKYSDIIRVITSDKNVGASKNSYRTMKACRGKYIAFCEGDDYWHRPDKLQQQVSYLETHPGCGLVYSDYDRYEAGSNRLIRAYNNHQGKKPPVCPTLIDILRARCGILTCTVCARGDVIQEAIHSDPILFSSGKFLMGDTPLWAEISLRADVHYFNEAFATYNVLEESATQSRDRAKSCRFWKSNAEMRVYLAKKHELPSDEIRLYENDLYVVELELAFQENNRASGAAAREKLGPLTLRQYVLFIGSQYSFLNRLLKVLRRGYGSVRRFA